MTASGGTPFLTALGYNAASSTTGVGVTSVGVEALYTNSTGMRSTAIGYRAGYSNTANNNLFIGNQSGFTNTTGAGNSFVSGMSSDNWPAGYYNTTGADNSAFGGGALTQNSTGSYNTAVGTYALHLNTTASYLTAVGYQAGKNNTTGASNVYMGYNAGRANQTGNYNVGIGREALDANTGDSNIGIGYYAVGSNTTGSSNTGVGREAISSNTTGSENTALGHQALTTNSTGSYNTGIGREALKTNTTASNSTAVGYQAGYAATGTSNQFFGYNSGSAITTGANNVILGSFTGNSNSRDIRTSSDSIVLSDGAGVPRMVCVNGGYWTTAIGIWASFGLNAHSAGVDNARLFSASSGTGTETMYFGNAAITTSSDVRLKENIVDSQRNATEIIKNLRVVDHTWNDPSDQCENNRNSRGVWTGLIAQEAINHIPWLVNKPTTDVDEKGNNQYWHMDYGYSVPLLIKALQEQQVIIESLKARLDAANL
jgi:hypothetical protein